MSEYDPRKSFKTIIIGKSSVGKSTLLLRYVDGEFNPQKPTVGIDYQFKQVKYGGKELNIQLWDSAGQERYRTIVYNYFALSKAACIVFDISTQDSLQEARMWLQQLVLHCGNEIPKVLLGNKCDLLDPQELKQRLLKIGGEIDKLKEQYNCQFFAVSAYTGKNVNEAFQYLIKELCKNMKSQDIPKPNNIKLTNKSVIEPNPKKKGKCC